MSKSIKRMITCPKCGCQQEAVLWNSINVTLDPWAKPKILDQSFFEFTCEKCQNTAPLSYSCLYHDMENKLMIYLIPQSRPKDMEVLDTEEAWDLYKNGYTLRVVGTVNELAEKIVIFQNGRDDRVIELCKLYMQQQLGRQRPDFIPQDIFYNQTKDKQEYIFIYNSLGKGVNAMLPQELYQLTEESFAQLMKNQDPADQRIVDGKWAMDMLTASQPAFGQLQ